MDGPAPPFVCLNMGAVGHISEEDGPSVLDFATGLAGVAYSLKGSTWSRRKRSRILAAAGLIVLLLALAVILLSIGTYTSVDRPPEPVVEMQTIQTAIDAMMSDGNLYRIKPSKAASNSWSDHPIGAYLRDPSTRYYYCWDATGAITGHFDSATPC